MKAGRFGMVAAVAVMTLGCAVKAPSLPSRNVPPGTLLFQFTRKVKGPVELTLDGVRVPVTQKVKSGQHLVVKGLGLGRHKYFISGPKDAFGPDQGEFELGLGAGAFIVAFSTNFDAALYGKAEPAPVAEGLPGVQATLEK